MSDEICAQLVTAVSTLAAAGLGGWFVWSTAARQLKHQSRVDAQRRLVEKMELLHEGLTRAERHIQRMQLIAIASVGFQKQPDLEGIDKKFEINDLHMLTDFYARDLRPFMADLDAALVSQVAAFAKICLDQKATPEGKGQYLEEIVTSATKAASAIKGAKTKLMDIVGLHTAIDV